MKRISWNSPVVLGFTIISGIVLGLNILTKGLTNHMFFSIYRTSFTDPFFYIRLFGHVLGHASVEHYTRNMVVILLVGPLLEEKYGSRRFLILLCLVAVVTGLFHIFLDGGSALLGASGIDFALIILASITGNTRSNTIPMTLIIVSIIYIGQEVYSGVITHDNISQLTHILGGIVGAGYGMLENK